MKIQKMTPNSGFKDLAITLIALLALFALTASTSFHPLSISGIVTTIAGATQVCGSDDGIGSAARFGTQKGMFSVGPDGIATDGTSLYVCDAGNVAIRKIAIGTGAVTTLAGSPGNVGSDDGIGNAARFGKLGSFNLPTGPGGITTDGTNLYVCDRGNFTIRRIAIATGIVTTLAGYPGKSGSDDGIGNAARFSVITGITLDGDNLYVCDEFTIRKIIISTSAVTTLAGSNGKKGSDDGIGIAARFGNSDYCLEGITTDGTNLYVCDEGNFTIRKVVIATGTVTTLTGFPGKQGSNDGIGKAALLINPSAITTDGSSLYLCDGNIIRKIVIETGAVTTLAGSVGIGSSDGRGNSAGFFGPQGITTDGTNLYVCDEGNETIRKIQ